MNEWYLQKGLRMKHFISAVGFVYLGFFLLPLASAADWPQFRGPNRSGIAVDARPPLTWTDKDGVQWKTPLPGPGSSSPIVLGDRVFVTCYSGYGADMANPG